MTRCFTAVTILVCMATHPGCGKKGGADKHGTEESQRDDGSVSIADMLVDARKKAIKAKCLNNLKNLVTGELMWAADHNGKFSEKLSDLYPRYISTLEVFACPSPEGPEISGKEDIDSKTSYILRQGMTQKAPYTEVLICEKPGHHGQKVNAAFADGHVEFLPISKLQQLIAADRPE